LTRGAAPTEQTRTLSFVRARGSETQAPDVARSRLARPRLSGRGRSRTRRGGRWHRPLHLASLRPLRAKSADLRAQHRPSTGPQKPHISHGHQHITMTVRGVRLMFESVYARLLAFVTTTFESAGWILPAPWRLGTSQAAVGAPTGFHQPRRLPAEVGPSWSLAGCGCALGRPPLVPDRVRDRFSAVGCAVFRPTRAVSPALRAPALSHGRPSSVGRPRP